MKKGKRKVSRHLFVETELGIVTRKGDWFHITRKQIEEFIPGLLEEYSLNHLIADAHDWVRSADSLSLTLLMVLLLLVNPWLAFLMAVTFHWFWHNYKSGFVNQYLSTVFGYMNSDGYLMIISLVVLSYLGIEQQYTAVGLGVLFFFLVKLGLLNKLWNRIIEHTSVKLTPNDRVLKMIMIMYAIKKNIAPPSVQKMEEKISQMIVRRRKGKNEG